MTKNDKLGQESMRRSANSIDYNDLKMYVCGMKCAAIYNRIKVCIELTMKEILQFKRKRLRFGTHTLEKSLEGNKMGKLRQRGYTFIELLVVVGVLAMILAAFYPSIMNTLETRGIENSARDIQNTIQRAKFQAVKTKLNHRVGFLNDGGVWFYFIEREDSSGTWNTMPGFIRKEIPEKLIVSLNFPNVAGVPSNGVVFSPLGFITNFDTNLNSISLQSDKLKKKGQPDLRVVAVFAGGSVHYIKTGS
jgi:prepilin-type N-terminal cleavage/methylation domain-containing protein